MARSKRDQRATPRRWAAESLEPRRMLAAGDLDLSFNGTGFNITSPISPESQFSTTMGIIPDGSNDIVMAGYRELGKSADRIKDPADLELVFLDSSGQLKTSIGSLGSVTAQVGLGDSRIAGLDFQILGGTTYIVTAGYTVVSGRDLSLSVDLNDAQTPYRVTSASRPFAIEDVGATLNIIDDGDSNSVWLPGSYTIEGFDPVTRAAKLSFAPAILGFGNGASGGWWTLDGSTDMLVSRFTYGGSQVTLDTSFGINGHAIIPVASGENNYDYGYAVKVDGLNRIVVAGYSQDENGRYDMSVARLLPNGTLDTTFYWANQAQGTQANRGRVMIDVRGDDYADAVSVTSSNQIIISGSSNGASSPAPTIVKLDTFGVPMTSFGTKGNGIVAFSSTQTGRGFINSTAIYPADAGALAGYLIATGTTTGSNRDTFIVRINGTTGVLDTAFGNDGVVQDDLGSGVNDWGNSVVLQPAGGGTYGVVIAGSIDVSKEGYNMYAARYLSDGKADNTFYGSSNLHILSELQDDGGDEHPDYGATVKLDSLNRIVVTGSSLFKDESDINGADYDMTAVRLIGTPAVASAQLNARSRSIVENDSGTQSIPVTLELTAAASHPVTVQYTTIDGSGKAGVDYVAQSGSITFVAGTTTRTVNVQMLGNTAYQPNRSFSLTILSAPGVDIGTSTATVTIRDNDGTWQNTVTPEDVDADGDVEPQDVLHLADAYRVTGPQQLSRALSTPVLWSDVNGDTFVTPADILTVLDTVNRGAFVGTRLLASQETSAATATPSTLSTVFIHANIAAGLSAPISTESKPLGALPQSSPVAVTAASPQMASPLPAPAVDEAMNSLAGDGEASSYSVDEDLYELIAS